MNTPEEAKRIEEYLRQRDQLVQLKEQESNLPKGYGNSIGWILYFLYGIPLSIVIVAGGPIWGSACGVFIVLYVLNKWLNEGEQLVNEEKKLTRKPPAKKRKKMYYRVDENGEIVEDSP
jgi:hypothetical protein